MVALNVISWLYFRYANKSVSIVGTINSIHGKDSFTIKLVSAGYLKTQILLITVRTFSRKTKGELIFLPKELVHFIKKQKHIIYPKSTHLII